tara:strand:+ start:1517 stop:2314 length:798 start_codon:yes stop_codon:yes gene_type:complete
MEFVSLYLSALGFIMIFMSVLWLVSVLITNASIVDCFWGICFLIATSVYIYPFDNIFYREGVLFILVVLWSLRLSIYLMIRNWGKGEDFRYQKFRQDFGEERYWWFSFFQVYLLQGVLSWIVSLPLMGAVYYTIDNTLNIFDYLGIVFWIIGFIYEAGADYQLSRFKSKTENKGKLLKIGFWKYTRHPNYFGNAMIWWGFGFFALAASAYICVIGSLIMTFLLVKVSGVALLERSMKKSKPGYDDYVKETSAFIPFFKINSRDSN